MNTLTPRQNEIVAIIIEGTTTKDAAAQLGISESTIKHHLSDIYDRLGCGNRVELVRFVLHQRPAPMPCPTCSPEARYGVQYLAGCS